MSSLATPSINHLIHTVRGHRVILDADLARLYEVPTRALNQAVKRNQDRFPEAFMFQLTLKEAEAVRRSRSQNVTLKQGQNIKYLPHAFTEHGALMAANVLNSRRAVQMSVQIVMAFVQLRRMALSVEALARKISQLEGKYDARFKVVFTIIREMMTAKASKRRIGFHHD